MSREERRAYEDYMVSVHAARDVWETAKEDGRREGLAEGRTEGRAEEKLENARNLRNNGVPVDIIAKSLGLTPEEIE